PVDGRYQKGSGDVQSAALTPHQSAESGRKDAEALLIADRRARGGGAPPPGGGLGREGGGGVRGRDPETAPQGTHIRVAPEREEGQKSSIITVAAIVKMASAAAA